LFIDLAPVEIASLRITVSADGTWTDDPLIVNASYTGRLAKFDYTNLGLSLFNLIKTDLGTYRTDVNFSSQNETRQVDLDVLDFEFCPNQNELNSAAIRFMTFDDPANQENVCARDKLAIYGNKYIVSIVIPMVPDPTTRHISRFYIRDPPLQYLFSHLGPAIVGRGGLVNYTFILTKNEMYAEFWPLQKYVYFLIKKKVVIQYT